MKKFLLGLILLLLIFLIYKSDVLKFEEKKERKSISLEVKGITLVGRSKGKKQWEIRAENIQLSRDKNLTTFSGISKGVFFKDGKEVLNFKADAGKYNSVNNNLEIWGNIQIISSEGVNLFCDKLSWKGGCEKLFTDSGVKLNFDNNFLEGKVLIADVKMQTIEIKGGIKGKFILGGKNES